MAGRRTKKGTLPSLKEILASPDVELSLTVPSGRIPPQAIDAEQSLLGSILLDGNTIIRVADFLRPEDFYKKQHHVVFRSMLELFGKHEPIDVLSAANTLKDAGVLEDVGGRAYLSSLVNIVPTPTHALQYAKIVKKKKVLRDLIDASHAIAELGWSESEDIERVLDEAERRIFTISEQSLAQEFLHVRNALTDAYDRIEKLSQREEGALRGVPTGFGDLDNMLSGLQKSDFVVLAARPSIGKTSLAMDIARNVALRAQLPVGIFSLEMSKEQVVDRLIAAESGVNLYKIRTGKLYEEDFDRIRDALDRLSQAPIFLDDSASTTALQMRTLSRRLQAEHGLGLVVVDYMQLMEPNTRLDNPVQQMTEISRSLKAMARELNVPVLAISQLSRAVESRPDQVPKLSDLRESGAIEQDADVVMFLWREDKVKKETPRKGVVEVHVAKHRNGPTGKLSLRFDEDRVSFWSLDKQHVEV